MRTIGYYGSSILPVIAAALQYVRYCGSCKEAENIKYLLTFFFNETKYFSIHE